MVSENEKGVRFLTPEAYAKLKDLPVAYVEAGNKKTPVELAYGGEFEIGCGSFPDSGRFVIYYR